MKKFTGLEYLKIDIANQMGYDKSTWDERLDWVDCNIKILESLTPSADKPLLFAKAVKALRDTEAGIPTGFVMGLDASSSGTQIMGILIGCEKTMRNTNTIDTGNREDVYGKVAKSMNTPVTRKKLKEALMTHFYGSIAEPRIAFGEGTPALATFYETIAEELTGAQEVMEDIQGCWQPEALHHSWHLPDGHYAHVKVMAEKRVKIEVDELDHATFTHIAHVNEPQEWGISLPANVIHS